MTTFVVIVCVVLGLVIGSFLNVVIWRVPRGESVVKPPSHCPNCDTEISPRDNVPVLSWLVLRGKCRHCGAPISTRYPLVELGTAALFGAFAGHFGAHADLPAFLYLAAVGVALAMIDIDLQRLPDALTLPSYPVGLGLLGIAAAVDHEPRGYVHGLIGMGALFLFYGVVWFIYPAGMGLGDVKLSGVVGLYLGWLGWGQLFVGAFAAFAVGSVVSVAIVLAQGGSRKTRVPFGPFMLIGLVIGIYAGHPIAHAYTHAFGV
jgi:leader peptidase (prepilin peptidase)/N-methyltransferase